MAGRRRILRAALVSASSLAALASGAGPAGARVQDYQVVRLLTFKSECQVDSLVERSGGSGPLHFFATCSNMTFYPDGVDIDCSDRDDERSCRILTPPKRFDSLDLLRR